MAGMEIFCYVWGGKSNDHLLPPRTGLVTILVPPSVVMAVGSFAGEDVRYEDLRQRFRGEKYLEMDT